MSSQRKPARRAAPAPPRPAVDHGQDPASADTRAQQDDGSTETTTAHSTAQKPATRSRGRRRVDTAGPSYPKRPTVPMSDDDFRELKRANAEDDIPTVTRIRAMIALWRENQRWRQQVDKRARRMS